jgi:LacI family transcriptional regulator
MERLLIGVATHARTAGWTFLRMPERIDPGLDWLSGWSGDGVIAAIMSPRDELFARTLRMPLVNVVAHLPDSRLPQVTLDHAAIGRLAAEHLINRRFQHFAFYGVGGRVYHALRRDAFSATIAASGGTCSLYETTAGTAKAWAMHQRRLAAWLRGLVRPVGIFACTDERAVELLSLCRDIGLRVPDEVAVIGVDDDPVLCEFAQPTLTSVARDDVAVGIAAAHLLDQLMHGRSAPAAPVRIPPVGVVERRSTATMIVDHPHLATLLARIDKHLHEPFNITELITGTPLSRRRIEGLFQSELGCSPHRYILGQRVARAKHLLMHPDRLTLTQVAARCGFSDLRHFRQAFLRLVGRSPAEMRAEAQRR